MYDFIQHQKETEIILLETISIHSCRYCTCLFTEDKYLFLKITVNNCIHVYKNSLRKYMLLSNLSLFRPCRIISGGMWQRYDHTGWPGCTRDARVLRNSSMFEDGEKGTAVGQGNFIIADSAYPLMKWIITLFRDTGHPTLRQHRFNRRLSSALQIVWGYYGHLKGRFRRLREITVRKPIQIVPIIISGCILHNLCVLSHNDIEDFIEEDHDVNANMYPNIFHHCLQSPSLFSSSRFLHLSSTHFYDLYQKTYLPFVEALFP